MSGRAFLAAALLAIAAGCARQPEPPPAPVRPAEEPVVVRPLFAADYVAAAASIDLFAIRSSELALQRATDPRLRDVARMLIDAHRGTSAQLSLAGRRLNLVPPATMKPNHQALLAELSAASDFDRTFVRQQLAVHREAVKLHRDFAERGESPTLRPVAANAAPIVERHIGRLSAL